MDPSPPPAPAPLVNPQPPAKPPATAPAARTPEQKKQEDIARAMDFLKVTQPDVYEQAKVLRDTDPPKFEKLVSGILPTVNRLETTKRRNPKIFDLCMKDLTLNYQSLRIANELKRNDLPSPDRKQLTEKLRTIVASEFDIQQQVRQLELEDLKKKVSDLDAQARARENDKETIISKRIEDLTERTPRLEW